jgi:hypothetical protein
VTLIGSGAARRGEELRSSLPLLTEEESVVLVDSELVVSEVERVGVVVPGWVL